jgi:hypothetical protein
MNTTTQTPAEAFLSGTGMVHTAACPTVTRLLSTGKANFVSKTRDEALAGVKASEYRLCSICVKIEKANEAPKAEAPVAATTSEFTNPVVVAEAPKAETVTPALAPARKTAARKSRRTIEAERAAEVKAAAKKSPAVKAETKAAPEAPKAKATKGAKASGAVNGKTLIEVFTKATEDGKMGTSSLSAYKLKVRAVLEAAGQSMETTDLVKLDVDATVEAFLANSKTIVDITKRSYIDAFRRAVRLFRSYVADPKGWDPKATKKA